MRRASGSGLKRAMSYQALLKRKNADKLAGFYRPEKRRTIEPISSKFVDYSHR